MITIRPYRDSDRKAVETICVATAPAALVATEKRKSQTLLLYNRYYTRASQAHCFVAADEQDRPVGYILCAPDFKVFRQGFLSKEVKALCKLGPAAVIQGYGEAALPKPFAKKYPAHLHIDIMPEYQRQGAGRKLMDTLLAHLQNLGVPGVMLVAGAQNHQAVAFYQKYGFQRLGVMGGSIVFGLKIK